MHTETRHSIMKGISVLVLTLLISLSAISGHAGTIVRVSTSVGDFSIELLDETAPTTVQNFLNYVNRNDYNGVYFHRSAEDFVVQGGAFRFVPFQGPVAVATDPPIDNEFNVSNTRGTVAMAKIPGDPNSATNQWFVNLADNLSLDTSEEGFTVFAQVLGEGMQILDAINELPQFNTGGSCGGSSVPYVTESYTSGSDFVFMNIEVVDRFSSAPHVFEASSGLMITSVDVNSGASLISMNFNLVPDTAEVIIETNLESIISRRDSHEGIASFSTTDNRLRIPSLEVNISGVASLVSNVVFVLSDPVLARFTLDSYDQ
ncbi:MAG: peptidylprolyl isomerase [Gammaproteobacteria bacterium]|nr:peptidylprolyl isomerase [Gammaproteobacteria bacterium]MDP6534855.1 peptidylprolyl isomerase [Gammaproteobacteria bacterium]MDP6732732.1 peptidylprolyl isomerase [Gammaproteobacteria bacterium]